MSFKRWILLQSNRTTNQTKNIFTQSNMLQLLQAISLYGSAFVQILQDCSTISCIVLTKLDAISILAVNERTYALKFNIKALKLLIYEAFFFSPFQKWRPSLLFSWGKPQIEREKLRALQFQHGRQVKEIFGALPIY